MSSGRESFAVEWLCPHHDFDQFDSGNAEVDRTVIPSLIQRVRERNAESNLETIVVVPVDSLRVQAIGSVVDAYLTSEADPDASDEHGLCVFYALVAVHREHHRGRTVLPMMFEALEAIGRRRLTSAPGYVGETAAPSHGPASLRTFLERRGFTLMRSDPGFWFRPKGSSQAGRAMGASGP